jgi:excisionase family DNA binding protein
MPAFADDPNELERRGHEAIAQGHALLARAAQLRARNNGSSEWIAVDASPLGRRRTLLLARQGRLEAAKVGRQVLIRASSLAAFIEANRRAPPEEDEDLFGANDIDAR